MFVNTVEKVLIFGNELCASETIQIRGKETINHTNWVGLETIDIMFAVFISISLTFERSDVVKEW